MKRLFILITFIIFVTSKTTCGDEDYTPTEPNNCHTQDTQDNNNYYCCYFEGKNLDTNQNEKYCWEYTKKMIDDGQYKDAIKQIEKGTDFHTNKKHSDVKLDCFSSYLKNLFLTSILILFL